jgi:3-oxoacyl-[acyl-carrier protein] reductase
MQARVLITGASSDIGLALMAAMGQGIDAPRFLAHFHSGADRLERFAERFPSVQFDALPADLTDPAAVDALADQILQIGAPTSLIHLPGLKFRYERFAKADRARLRLDFALQVESAFALCQRLLPAMAKLPSARVVFLLSSVTRDVPPRHLTSYVTVKYAQLGLMRALAADWAGSSIRINAVAPGMVDTRFLDELPQAAREMAANQNPLGRLATVDEVASSIMFMLSESAAYLHGVVLPLSGGATT